MNFLKNYILHFLAHKHAKDTNPTLICHCVYDDILQVPLVSTHFIFSCQLPNDFRSPWTYFFRKSCYSHRNVHDHNVEINSIESGKTLGYKISLTTGNILLKAK